MSQGSKPRKFSGYGVITRQGRLLWQYNRPKEAETREAYERHNPQLEGHEDGHQLAKLSILLEPIE